jgi:hypothetical protein
VANGRNDPTKRAEEAAKKAEEAAKKAEEAAKKVETSGNIHKGIATGLPIAAVALALFGIKDGTLARIILNASTDFFKAALVLVISIILASVAAFIAARGRAWAAVILDALAALVFFFGVVWIGNLAVETAEENERPRISGKVTMGADGVPTLEGTVTAEGLRTEEHVLIRVLGRSTFGLHRGRTGRDSLHEGVDEPAGPTQLLFATRMGPDRDGKVDRSFGLPLTPGLYDVVDIQAVIIEPVDRVKQPRAPACDEASRIFGCLSIWLPQPSSSPQLAVTWEPGTPTQALAINSKAGGVLGEGGVRIYVLGRAANSGDWSRPFHTSFLSPLPTGVVDSSIKIPLVRDYSKVCVVASMFDHLTSTEDYADRPDGCPRATLGRAVIRTDVPLAGAP